MKIVADKYKQLKTITRIVEGINPSLPVINLIANTLVGKPYPPLNKNGEIKR
tara:strand:+ start:3413 stop:3568 length:156 start_codon:yes stop_codon:yes gene_type:complete